MNSTSEAVEGRETRQFQAETKQLLNLMVHSLYTHKEIFLRELISNASDALDKVRFRALTDESLLKPGEELEIRLEIDKENHSFSISDNGIGMTREEVIENIGTIAQSGSQAFLEAFENKKENQSTVDLIGQFGVGFYSAFMVAHKIELITRASKDEKATHWISEGEGTYTLEETERESRGTTVVIHLREDLLNPDQPEEDFENQYTVQNLVKKYSDYIRYPINMGFVKEEHPRDEKGEMIKDAEPTIKVEDRTLNSQTPIWEKAKKDISFDDYFQFYKHHFHDWNEPADIIHLKVEGAVQYTALLFIPATAPVNLYSADYNKGIQLYSKHVFVMDNCKELFPDHLRFVRGLVDSPDFSLNISREILQHGRQLKMIAKNLEKKVMEALKTLLEKKRDKYEEWWNEFGKAIKGGIYMHYTNKEKLQDYLLFPSSVAEKGLSSLKEYSERMPENQKHIYYKVGKDRNTIERLPQMEMIREKGIEVLYFFDKVDEFLTQNLHEYNEKELKSISRGDFDLDEDKKKKKKKEEKGKKDEKPEKKEHEDLLAAIKDHLGEKVKEVRLSKRLRSSPVCLVSSDSGPSFNMEMLLKEANQPMGRAQRILELNPNHDIFQIMLKSYEKDKKSATLKIYSEVLYSQAMLIEGYTLEDPVECSNQIYKLMAQLGKEGES